MLTQNSIFLAKLKYFTNLGFPEIFGDFPYSTTIWGKSVVWGRTGKTDGHVALMQKKTLDLFLFQVVLLMAEILHQLIGSLSHYL